ncbi:transcriptional repressor [Burkholderia sp. Ac-20379]|nr:transcriptional repressor [Burkholderia sp. Ac-20379]
MNAIFSNLKKAHMRPTATRIAVYRLFHESPNAHFTADQVFRRLADQDEPYNLSSIYRALGSLQEASLILGSSLGMSKVVYELNRGDPHIHLVCTRCDAIQDIQDPAFEAQQARIAEEHDFSYLSYNHVVFGICGACMRRLKGKH